MVFNRKKIKGILLLGVAVLIPFTMGMGNAAIIVAAIFNLIFLERERFSKLRSFKFLFPLLFFVIVIIWAVFSNDFKSGVSRLDRHLLSILLTIIFINHEWDSGIKDKVLRYFSWSMVISAIVLLVLSLFKIANGASIQDVSFHSFTEPYDQHPVYYSLMATLALFYFLDGITKSPKAIKFVAVSIMLIVLIFCASKAVLFIDLVLLVTYVVKVSKNWRQRLLFILAALSIILGAINVGFLKQRFLEGLLVNENVLSFEPSNDFAEKKQFSYQEKDQLSDLDLRLVMAEISTYHLIEDSKLLFGYGPGMAQDYFDYYLHTYNLAPNWFEGFNVHNQFLHILFNYGILVFLTFCMYVVVIFKKIVESREFVPIVFLCATVFVFFFEVVLIRNKGIIFFYFFTLLFITNSEYFENRNLGN